MLGTRAVTCCRTACASSLPVSSLPGGRRWCARDRWHVVHHWRRHALALCTTLEGALGSSTARTPSPRRRGALLVAALSVGGKEALFRGTHAVGKRVRPRRWPRTPTTIGATPSPQSPCDRREPSVARPRRLAARACPCRARAEGAPRARGGGRLSRACPRRRRQYPARPAGFATPPAPRGLLGLTSTHALRVDRACHVDRLGRLL